MNVKRKMGVVLDNFFLKTINLLHFKNKNNPPYVKEKISQIDLEVIEDSAFSFEEFYSNASPKGLKKSSTFSHKKTHF